MATFKDEKTGKEVNCLDNCAGHSKGYEYAQGGGSTFSPWSKSFNRGMRLFMGYDVPKSYSNDSI